MRGFALTVSQQAPDVFVVALRGELDMTTAYSFDEEVRALERRRPSLLVLDLRELSFLDSSGLARLLALRRRAQRSCFRVLAVRPSRDVQRLLSLAAVDRAFSFVDEPGEALAYA